ncbi:MAG: ribonuclease Y [Bacillota bacterium]|nr:ribonuclease Y [Bacillota bacterium]
MDFHVGSAIIAFVVTAVVAFPSGYLVRKRVGEAQIKTAEIRAAEIVAEAKREASSEKKAQLVEVKDEIIKMKEDFEKEVNQRRHEISLVEAANLKKSESLDKRAENIEKKEEKVRKNQSELDKKANKLKQKEEDYIKELEKVALMSSEEAKQLLLNELEREIVHESAVLIRKHEQKLKDDSDRLAREIISIAMQRAASDEVSETTVSVVVLPNDEMKGRIIGREGRNIRALETITGVDLIIDDTPEAVVLSSFDPVRREVARLTLEKLIQDGRIHPTRIEEMYEKSKKEIDEKIKEYGENALLEVGIHNLHPELVKHMGRLHYRTSYGQNVLRHSIEVGKLCGIMASELGMNPRIARRAGFLHDIGKSIDRENEGTHVELGVSLLKRYKESWEVVHAVSTHHGDYEPETIEAILVIAADTLSAARPGARSETLNTYVKRLEALEEIATSYDGVEKTFAIQAGREVRIMVSPEKVSDDEMILLARKISKRVEDELQYPGEIKVNIIRETRATAFAR